MVDRKLIEIAFFALLHDIGKFYQRTKIKSDLTEDELKLTPISKKANFHTHLHSGYTSRFLQEVFGINSENELLTSAHHLDIDDKFARIIRKADHIASAIDRNDEEYDTVEKNSSGNFQRVRLSSIFNEIDFGRPYRNGVFEINQISSLGYPIENYTIESKEQSVKRYKKLFDDFLSEITRDNQNLGEINQYLYDRVYSSLYEYTSLIPASSYEGNKTFVSLFDHSKLTSAIASCLFLNEENNDDFYMFEFDVSGIQSFIFKVTEGKDTKRDIAKSLRGRSLFVSLVTNIITYHYLYSFGLTQSNILFNTGGGALLLLPATPDFNEKIANVTDCLKQSLYEMFKTDITFVSSYVSCTAKELESFKIEKAVLLKSKIDEEKSRKYYGLMNDDLYFQSSDKQYICKMCGSNFTDENQICDVCSKIKQLSDYFVKSTDLITCYNFNNYGLTNDEEISFTLGDCNLILTNHSLRNSVRNYSYIESLNHNYLGNTRYITNLVPLKNDLILPFESIANDLINDDFGDKKLGILKMDVDYLGSIFAFGLSESRSISKFLTLSRLIELFFGKYLMDICKEVSLKMNNEIVKLTDNENMFYVNYSGGDDLVIIGPVAAIVELANDINKKFKKFTLNDNITISGGIYIQTPKEPIRFGVQRADDYLNMSKNADGKNSITLLNTTCNFGEYEKVLKKVDEYKQYIINNDISRSCVYQIMSVLDGNSYESYLRSVPKIFYSLKRNVQDENIRRKLICDLSSIQDTDELSKQILNMKLAIMQTRG